jgi:two-component system cell cycle response regulator
MSGKFTTAHKSTGDGDEALPYILIVDDSPTIRVSLTRFVRDDFTPLEASNGEEAWELIQNDERIEVVISDISMPELDGFGLVERMRSSEVLRIQNLPVIVMTGADDTDARERAAQAGANDFLAKTSDRVELLARLQAQRKLAKAIRQLEESQRELREQSSNDVLTGLPNRSFFHQVATKEISLMRRQKEYFAVMKIDIDHLENINESHGYPAGDFVISQVAGALAETARDEDMVARIGGKEFAVGSPYTNRLAAIVLAERLRKAVEALELDYEGRPIDVTISIGIALVPQDGDNLEDALAEADDRLEIAKEGGRNRFCAADKKSEDREVDVDVDVDVLCPDLDEAISMISHGNLHRVMPYLPKLLEDLIPLFELVNEESAATIDVDQVRAAIEALKR